MKLVPVKELNRYMVYCTNRLSSGDICLDERIFLHQAISYTKKQLEYWQLVLNTGDIGYN